MKYLTLVWSFLGTCIVANSSYAAPIDCNQYSRNKNTYQICQEINQTVEDAKKRDEKRFQELLKQKQLMPRNRPSQLKTPTQPSSSAATPSSSVPAAPPAVPPITQPEVSTPPASEPEPVTSQPAPVQPAPQNQGGHIYY